MTDETKTETTDTSTEESSTSPEETGGETSASEETTTEFEDLATFDENAGDPEFVEPGVEETKAASEPEVKPTEPEKVEVAEIKEEVATKPESTPEVEAKKPEEVPEVKPTEAATTETKPEETPTPTGEEKPTEPAEELPTATYEWTPEQRAENREKLVVQLSDTYGMTEEQGMELLEAPEKVLPKLAANLYVDILEATLAGVANYLPNMINHVSVQRDVAATGRKAFFDAFPMLDDDKYQDTVSRLAFNYRQSNPTIDQKTFIKEVGVQALMALGLREHLKKLADLDGTSNEAPTKPHKPARGGGAAHVDVTEPLNEWEELAKEDV